MRISAAATNQIRAFMAEKASRTPAQRKISSHLLYGMKSSGGKAVAPGVQTPRSAVLPDAQGMVLVDIRGNVTKALIKAIESAGGRVIYSSVPTKSVRARVPMKKLETLAARKDVRYIGPAISAFTQRYQPEAGAKVQFTPNFLAAVSPNVRAGLKPGFDQRAQRIAAQLAPLIAHAGKSSATTDATGGNPSPVNTAGDIAHRANEARDFFGINGAGVKVGVLSDSVDHLDEVQAAGNLPDVTVLPGQSGLGEGNSGEGTAMLEIVHSIAPGAQLFFATAFTSDASFADNIRALRAAGCDVIVDDVFYFNEPPYQDGIIAQGVTDVTNEGALYFSSAGNAGNFDTGTSGVWQGDFKSGGSFALIPGGDVHDFGNGIISNFILADGFAVGLFWSDPQGASSNDYDLYMMAPNLDEVLDASTDTQDGSQDPFEIVGSASGLRILVVRNDGAEVRALHVNSFRGILALRTPGQTHGHGSVAKAFSVAAVDVATAKGGPFVGGPTEPVETFSSDGPRRIFLNIDGSAVNGKVLFANGGGVNRRKPDLAAADGVQVTTPGFNPFFGTSAAAPHAAALGALVKAAKPALSQTGVRTALTKTSLDIMAPKYDRDAGSGIATAFDALLSVGAQPRPVIVLGTATATPGSGPFVVPGGNASLAVQLINNGGATALNVSGTLGTSTPGVTITGSSSAYPSLGSNGGAAVNLTPFAFALDSSAPCGLKIEFTLTVTSNSNASPQVFAFTVQTGKPNTVSKTIKYTNPIVAIPDDDPVGANATVNVAGVPGRLANLKFLIAGASCSADAGATGVGIDHTFVGDLIVTLTSPSGTSVKLINRPGSGSFGSSGNNFCQTLLDDNGTVSIETINGFDDPPLGPPYTGTFKPANPLAGFVGDVANGTWTLNVSDNAFGDIGNIRKFSLIATNFSCK
jgi:subtilisin-like proprotein convertase family protein